MYYENLKNRIYEKLDHALHIYEKLIYVMILISKDDFFCSARIMRADTDGFYSPFYNRIFGPNNKVRDKIDERYMRLLRRLNRADVIEFVKEKKSE